MAIPSSRCRFPIFTILIVNLAIAGFASATGAEGPTEGRGLNFHVSPSGDDSNAGTKTQPFRSIVAAQRAVRPFAGKQPVTVWLHGGTFYLPEPIRFTASDGGTSNAPVVIAALPGERPVLSGGVRLELQWKPAGQGLFQASTPAGLDIDQMFVNGSRQPMARYPNYNANARQFNGSAPDAIAPERVARWADPSGGYIHAMHSALWGDMHWRMTGKKADGSLTYEGGWQNNRPSEMHPQFRFVENIREELDAPGEWFHDTKNQSLLFLPPAGLDLTAATVEVVRLRHLIEWNGTREEPVRFITLRGLTFRHTARTFMDNREPLLRSDWTVYRGGAVLLRGAEDSSIEDCDFDQLGGNTIFVSEFNRRVTIRGCLIRESGANGIAFMGDPKAVRSPLFNYSAQFDYAKLDRAPGPLNDQFPADCLVDDCLITRSGRFEKQTAPIAISMAQNITVRHCSIYDVPRAGINIGDGCWGGHLVELCDIFDTVLETGDHGSFNSWGRDRYWHPDVRVVDKQVQADPALPFLDAVRPVVLRNNRWRCDHGWAIDLDDGSSNFEIYNNLLLAGGLKLREGYRRSVTNNIILNDSLHPHVWFESSGDVFLRNIVMGAYQPAIMQIAHWGQEIDHNLFATVEANRVKFAANGCDANSLVGDPLFVAPDKGDFQVQKGSPAAALGFVNFPMDQFGVRSPRLRALARSPQIPEAKIVTDPPRAPAGREVRWLGASLRELLHWEFSALGVAADGGGVFVAELPESATAWKAGLRAKDLVVAANGRPVRTMKGFLDQVNVATGQEPVRLEIVRNQQRQVVEFPPGLLRSDR